ncbi:macrocin O-methyltransferase [Polaribacter aestuariivivens]|uniref:Macrocin O-methyltransferase n=1 Tax=Polaribacter aestuariivivens TaxID=2304626 RepID=A0A5S3N7N2_9FLAO|nr:TylF/MycF/NovP-related O-methyltransferase [Polaribacter aestuariivivens]TMM31355.1 macrocin O-methyltransferase [Polaribacter aestuariivivens]
MVQKIKKKIHNLFFKEFQKKVIIQSNHSDFSDLENDIIKKVTPYTLTNPERLVSLLRALDYINQNQINGSIVECGVWKGGSIMAGLYKLKNLNDESRDIYLYDTFEGMSEPLEIDKSIRGESATNAFKSQDQVWDRIECLSPLEEVVENVNSVGYSSEKINFIKGKVEDTINKTNAPKEIAILRLDTDWYESTKHELEMLFPKLAKGGVLIIDDYGHWQGCKKAVDEYFSKNNIQMYLSRVDYTCRIGVKQ